MALFSPHLPCPCGSEKRYSECCARYHRGAAAPTALLLMKSRYSAYAVGLSEYIMLTTHPEHPDFWRDKERWRAEIEAFSRETDFLHLEITAYTTEEDEAYVTYTATLSTGILREKSRFLKVSGRWLYVEGTYEVASHRG